MLPQGANAVRDFIPVARISDMLLHPGAEFTYNGETFSYPDTKLIYWAGGNPFHHHQDLNRMCRAWQVPGSIIVHEQYWTAAAKHADIVLPATTSLERNDDPGEGELGQEDLEKHGNPNVLTLGRGASGLSQGCAAQTCLVEIVAYSQSLPEVTAHRLPNFRTPAEGC